VGLATCRQQTYNKVTLVLSEPTEVDLYCLMFPLAVLDVDEIIYMMLTVAFITDHTSYSGNTITF